MQIWQGVLVTFVVVVVALVVYDKFVKGKVWAWPKEETNMGQFTKVLIFLLGALFLLVKCGKTQPATSETAVLTEETIEQMLEKEVL